MRVAIGLVIAACLAAGACNRASTSGLFPTVPGPAPTVYAGSITDSINGTGTLKVSLTDAAGLTSGTWEMMFGAKADPVYFISGPGGSTTYTANVTTCSASFSGGTSTGGCVTNCEFSFAGSLTSSSLNGTYTAVSNQSCLGRTGTIATKH